LVKTDVTLTALFVAAVRARENERDNPLFRDELSALLAGPEGLEWLAEAEANPQSNYRRDSFPYLEVRTRFFDDWALDAVRKSGSLQLVILGAGMDTRAFRLPWPKGLRFFELDTPSLFSLKEDRLHSAGAVSSCDRRVVGADLSSDGWLGRLVSAGFAENKATVWLAEGLLFYLRPHAVYRILEASSRVSSPGSRLGAEVLSMSHVRGRSSWSVMSRGRAPWYSGTDDPKALFEQHGWALDRLSGPAEAAVNFGRIPPARGDGRRPRSGELPGSWFVSAVKR
jgi:methyltransferase (TIGR00027 family)